MIIRCYSDKISDNKIDELTNLLHRCVLGGASVGYTDAKDQIGDMKNYWVGVNHSLSTNNFKLISVEVDNKIVGVVGLDLCTKANGKHRGEICKLLVLPDYRRKGLARRLMLAAEQIAWETGLTLLTLDTNTKGITVSLYTSLGWQVSGEIPEFAQSIHGDLESTTIMFKLNPESKV
ncbi:MULTISPECIES: GNAT family N-acetyltransferase [Providencia]|uniref:GNAT family N-acetyltransferase n=1 Tax=Providencia TaxID=586 RepID=UPI001F03D1AF|nr:MULTISPECIES: GNAT family N-acetyltransferase [Providencia]EJD6499392.1 GNAT family N-acetyltransferase [Providencia rettgeri]EJD6642996.1 GNAT family N-acetyltransferase [Providencia rettgeri]EJD6644974.1 GNAT family N-acetyltransferase [Providencia rettgeri]ELL9154100.1 GNAT family N-acetyltransferase [Providencia rettgeri]ELL9156163.1 GNAT family N-acetyltransferase [Providencia rettgeri]